MPDDKAEQKTQPSEDVGAVQDSQEELDGDELEVGEELDQEAEVTPPQQATEPIQEQPVQESQKPEPKPEMPPQPVQELPKPQADQDPIPQQMPAKKVRFEEKRVHQEPIPQQMPPKPQAVTPEPSRDRGVNRAVPNVTPDIHSSLQSGYDAVSKNVTAEFAGTSNSFENLQRNASMTLQSGQDAYGASKPLLGEVSNFKESPMSSMGALADPEKRQEMSKSAKQTAQKSKGFMSQVGDLFKGMYNFFAQLFAGFINLFKSSKKTDNGKPNPEKTGGVGIA